MIGQDNQREPQNLENVNNIQKIRRINAENAFLNENTAIKKTILIS